MQMLDQIVLQAEYEAITKVLIEVGFNKKKAAERLGIDRKTIYNKLKRFDENPDLKKLEYTLSYKESA